LQVDIGDDTTDQAELNSPENAEQDAWTKLYPKRGRYHVYSGRNG
jgi:hypothetical protein